jgi:hypothetical protein
MPNIVSRWYYSMLELNELKVPRWLEWNGGNRFLKAISFAKIYRTASFIHKSLIHNILYYKVLL